MAKRKKLKHTEETKKSISKSMEGNDNAEKWTEEVVIGILNEMIDMALEEDQEQIVISKAEGANGTRETYRVIKRCIHLKTELLINKRIWNKKWFSDMATKFKENRTVS